jgi:antitoxin (DNA-binding transcriptional repressor) of toxin-antitoxin stability system
MISQDNAERVVDIEAAAEQLSGLVEDAAAGQEVIIVGRDGRRARLVALDRRIPVNAMGITYIAPDLDAIDPDVSGL